MSFAQEVKKEIAKRDFGKYKKEMSCGLIYFSRNFSPNSIGIQTENESTALIYKKSIERYTNVNTSLSFGGEKKPLYTAVVLGDLERNKIFNVYSGFVEKILLDIKKNGEKSPIINPFLTGAFLSCGNLSNPQKLYYLDFSMSSEYQAEIIRDILNIIKIKSKIMIRKNNYVVYVKESGSIEDLLTYMGATKATLELIDVKIYKEIRNDENRKNNFEIANIEKTAAAAAEQIFDIEYIVKEKGWDFFSDDILDIAKKRIENPELSLGDLSGILDPPLSRSSANRRLIKIRNLAERIRSSKKGSEK